MSRIENIKSMTWIIIFCIFFVGCTSEDPNPEFKDPIYLDLIKKRNELQSEVENAKLDIEDAIKNLRSASADTIDKKVFRKQLKVNQRRLAKLNQEFRYFEIRAERRRVEGRRSYKLAFHKGEKWPNPKEYEYYLINKKLVQSPRNWSHRVPKNVDRYTKPRVTEM